MWVACPECLNMTELAYFHHIVNARNKKSWLFAQLSKFNTKFYYTYKFISTHTLATFTCRAIKSTDEFTSAVTRCDVFTLRDTGTEGQEEISFINNQRGVAINQSAILNATFSALLTQHPVLGRGKREEQWAKGYN